ncbi:MAG: VOC family protein [Myxococcota bacterium]|nr:VOC family protein [Myxococcota bacterium]
MTQRADLLGVYLFVRDLDATLGFYSLLGLSIEKVSRVFARAIMPNGSAIEFGCAELTRSYDPEWQEPIGPATNTINFELPSRADVDATYEALVGAGHKGHVAPCDPPWQARFALVDDPDGNIVGLHSPRDRQAERGRERA